MIEQPPNNPLDRCYIGACHRAGKCMYQPCRAPAPKPEHPGVAASIAAFAIGVWLSWTFVAMLGAEGGW